MWWQLLRRKIAYSFKSKLCLGFVSSISLYNLRRHTRDRSCICHWHCYHKGKASWAYYTWDFWNSPQIAKPLYQKFHSGSTLAPLVDIYMMQWPRQCEHIRHVQNCFCWDLTASSCSIHFGVLLRCVLHQCQWWQLTLRLSFATGRKDWPGSRIWPWLIRLSDHCPVTAKTGRSILVV